MKELHVPENLREALPDDDELPPEFDRAAKPLRYDYPKRATGQVRKQVSAWVDLEDWKAARLEAARVGVTTGELIRAWIAPHLAKLRGNDGL